MTRRSNTRGISGTRPGNRFAMSSGGVPAVSDARQTTTPPSSLNFADVIHGVRSGVASSRRCGRDGPSATRAASCGSPATACSGRLVRRWKFSPKKRPIADAGNRCRNLGAFEPRLNDDRRDHRKRRSHNGGEPRHAQHTQMAQMNQIAGEQDDRQTRHQQRNGRASGDVIDPEQRRNQTSGQRRCDGEGVDEFLRPADRPAAGRSPARLQASD